MQEMGSRLAFDWFVCGGRRREANTATVGDIRIMTEGAAVLFWDESLISAFDSRSAICVTMLSPKREDIAMKMTVTFSVHVPFQMKKDKESYVAWCPPLDVYSMGYSTAEAKKNLAEAVRLFITSCYERGTLDAVLKACGFRPIDPGRKIISTSVRQKLIAVDLPFRIDEHSAQCHT
jgi:predicted RNase H-like HicB family nuclease